MNQETALIRQRMKTPRAAAVAGIIFSLLLIAGYLLIWISIIDLIPQHDRQPNPQLASHATVAFPRSFLEQLATLERFKFWVQACGVAARFTPEKSQQGTALFYGVGMMHYESLGFVSKIGACKGR